MYIVRRFRDDGQAYVDGHEAFEKRMQTLHLTGARRGQGS